ncbi:MAG: dihydropteroate synthase [Burkholderiales bacterium]|nr:dihydropteroate synthase [Burkholderiales bacterium]
MPLVMGVVNITPDSFSDGGRFLDPAAALRHAEALVADGADLLDLGAESSRPGAAPLPLAEEGRRLLPVLRAAVRLGVPVSVDTYKPELMAEAVASGAAMLNDIRAFGAPGAFEVACRAAAGGTVLAMMHMRGDPATMQAGPAYADVVAEVRAFLGARVAAFRAAGVADDQLVIDPGFGFGKTVAHNVELLRHLDSLGAIGVAVLAGLSRKSTIGALTGRTQPEGRVFGSVAAALIAAQNGATILRVHDVAATRDALAVWQAVRTSR